MTDSMNELINDEAVYRTAPATPGLLNTETISNSKYKNFLTTYFSLVFCYIHLEHGLIC